MTPNDVAWHVISLCRISTGTAMPIMSTQTDCLRLLQITKRGQSVTWAIKDGAKFIQNAQARFACLAFKQLWAQRRPQSAAKLCRCSQHSADIPAYSGVAGNKKANLTQLAANVAYVNGTWWLPAAIPSTKAS